MTSYGLKFHSTAPTDGKTVLNDPLSFDEIRSLRRQTTAKPSDMRHMTSIGGSAAKKLLVQYKIQQADLREQCKTEKEYQRRKEELLKQNSPDESKKSKRRKNRPKVNEDGSVEIVSEKMKSDLARSFEAGKARLTVNEHRAKYIRATTPEFSSRIAHKPVDVLDPKPVPSFFPSLLDSTVKNNKSETEPPLQLYSPRSFDRPVRTPLIVPPQDDEKVERLATPEWTKMMDEKLGAEAHLMWDTVNAAKRLYSKTYGSEVRGQTRELADRYLRYMHNNDEIGNVEFRKYMKERTVAAAKADSMSLLHEQSLADCIKYVLEKEVVADIPFNKKHITEEQMKLIMMKAARTADQLELFYVLLDEVTAEFLFSPLVPDAMKEVEAEIINRETAVMNELDPILSNYTLRQLRAELKRYGKSEQDFRKELDSVNPPNRSQGIRGVLRKQCLVRLIKQQQGIHGILGKGDRDIGPAVERPWTNIIRYGTARGLDDDGDEKDYQIRRRRRMNDKKKNAYEKKIGSLDNEEDGEEMDFMEMQVVVDPYVRNQMVGSILSRYSTARELRLVVKQLGGIVSTPGLKGDERRKKLANNLVDFVAERDDLFRAWKAVLLSGGTSKSQGGIWDSELVDDLLSFSSVVQPGSRGLSSRGGSAFRRDSRSSNRVRPASNALFGMGVNKSDEIRGSMSARALKKRPITDGNVIDYENMVDWKKTKNEHNEEVWRNTLTGETVPIRQVFHPEYRNNNKNSALKEDGVGAHYLEDLLRKGVSVPITSSFTGGGYIGDDDFRDMDNEEKVRTKNIDKLLRRRSLGDSMEMPGSELALLRSKIIRERKMKEMDLSTGDRNVFVAKTSMAEDDDSGDESVDSNMSDTEIIADHIVSIIESRMGNFVLEELMLRFGGGPAGKVPKKKNNKDEVSIEVRDEFSRVLDEFQFYYDRLEVPVSRLKIKLLRELLAKAPRIPAIDDVEEDDNDDNDNDDDDHNIDNNGADNSSSEKGILESGTEVYYFDKARNELRDALVKKVHFDDFEPYYTIVFEGKESKERQTTRAFLTKKWAPKVKESPKQEPVPDSQEPPEPEQEPDPKAAPRLEWSRYKDERGHDYYHNNRTGASTYMNPYVKPQEESSDEEEEEEEIFPLPKDPELLGFLVFCTILVQKHFRGNKARKLFRQAKFGPRALVLQKRARGMIGRNFARRLFAKQIRKTHEGGTKIYEDITTGQIFFNRPVIFKYIFPNSKF